MTSLLCLNYKIHPLDKPIEKNEDKEDKEVEMNKIEIKTIEKYEITENNKSANNDIENK